MRKGIARVGTHMGIETSACCHPVSESLRSLIRYTMQTMLATIPLDRTQIISKLTFSAAVGSWAEYILSHMKAVPKRATSWTRLEKAIFNLKSVGIGNTKT